MYLVSIYFDDKTNETIRKYIERVAEKTGNTFMIDGKVPPHITVGAFETKNEIQAKAVLEETLANRKQGKVQLVSVGTFQTSSIFISAVYNEYLHEMCKSVCHALENVDNTMIRKNYQPFHWLPHCTIAKQLSKEQMQQAFEVMQKQFAPLNGKVVRIGVAKTNPHRDIKVWEFGTKI
jgi:2'-5' RNA ligase